MESLPIKYSRARKRRRGLGIGLVVLVFSFLTTLESDERYIAWMVRKSGRLTSGQSAERKASPLGC